MRNPPLIEARALANAFLAGDWVRTALLARGAEAAGASGRWLRFLVHDVLAVFPAPPRDARDSLAAFIVAHEGFAEIWQQRWHGWRLRRWFADAPQMRPSRWPVRRLDTLHDVAVWLGLGDGQLEWLADRKGLERTARVGALQNYSYVWVPKPSGGLRLLEAPKSRLKRVQRKILHEILDALPVHDAAHGFCRGRSAVTHARLHVGQPGVARFDLRDFFASVNTGRAYGVFRAAGYPEEVARTLIGLCTNQAPRAVLAKLPRPTSALEVRALHDLRRRLEAPHLPQGAPTSPALANLTAFGLDVRLSRLAEAIGATYSRYADDLAFSGDKAVSRLPPLVREIVRDEGFALNDAKTRLMTEARRQEVTGIVVNRSLNTPRADRDRLRAALHECARKGPRGDAAALREQLAGRVAWVESLGSGAKLRAAFLRIEWP